MAQMEEKKKQTHFHAITILPGFVIMDRSGYKKGLKKINIPVLNIK